MLATWQTISPLLTDKDSLQELNVPGRYHHRHHRYFDRDQSGQQGLLPQVRSFSALDIMGYGSVASPL